MDDLASQLSDLDPDPNYYDNLITENHVFSTFDSVEDFLLSHSDSMTDNNFTTIFCQNIRSLNRNLDNFLCMFPENKMPDIFIFTETWHDINTPSIIPGYIGYHTVRQTGRSGGVSLYAKTHLNTCIVAQLSFANNSIELCTIKISNAINNLFVCGIYRPHSDSIDNFCAALENILNDNNVSSSHCIFAGDYNINLMSADAEVDRFTDMMRSHHYLQLISDITHPAHNISASSLIDHIWTNNLCNHSCGILKTGITDHYTLFLQIPFITEKISSGKINIKFRDCSESNKLSFENNLSHFNWDSLKSDDVNIYTNNFITALNNIYQESFPLKTKTVTQKYFNNPWHSPAVKKLSNARIKYHNLLKENIITQAEYARFRNKITSHVRSCKEKFYQNCFSRNFANIRATWKNIRLICNGYQDRSIDKITIDGINYKDSINVANLFNNFFINIANELDNNLPTCDDSPYSFVKLNTLPPLIFSPATLEECKQIISSLKESKQDINCISVKLFKDYHHYFLKAICNMVNLSLHTGKFPNCLKHAIVIPIFKKGDPCNISNYRPIALLPFISKIFERCIFNRLLNYATTCNLLTPHQFGFTKGKSTQDAIIMLTEQIYECFNKLDGSFCLNIFIDFQKCFDTINHTILINKLRLYGIDGLSLDLIQNYLTNRTQSVRIREAISSPLSIKIGLPQGSILGPLLFLFFINDLPNISNQFTPILFADDTTLSFHCANVDNANTLCNQELKKFFTWTQANRLSINLGKNKTYYIVHTYNRNIDMNSTTISLNNTILDNVNEGLFLGVTIDKELKYISHINNICKKIAKSIGIMFKLKNLKMPNCVLKQVYYSLIYPYLNYNICSYAGTYDTHLYRLKILQKRAIRILSNAPFLAHTDILFQANKILKFDDIYKLNIGLVMYENRNATRFLRNHSYNTRNRSDLLPDRARLTITENYLGVIGPNVWNNIPPEIQEAPSRDSFKHKYKNLLLLNYSH